MTRVDVCTRQIRVQHRKYRAGETAGISACSRACFYLRPRIFVVDHCREKYFREAGVLLVAQYQYAMGA